MARWILSLVLSAGMLAGGLFAQNPPPGYFTTACLKIHPGKGAEYRQFVQDYSRKMAQARVEAGEIASWTLLRTIMPAGDEARCDFISVVTYKAAPPQPQGLEGMERTLQKAGLKTSAAAFIAKRDTLNKLVASEMWRAQQVVGEPEKGDYLYVNYMKVHNLPEYMKFEKEVWRPLAEAYVKGGSMRSWMFHTAMLPGGTDRKYAAVTVDVFPSWDAVFKPLPYEEAFGKAHPGKPMQETMAPIGKLRDLAVRELYTVHDKVGSGPATVSQR